MRNPNPVPAIFLSLILAASRPAAPAAASAPSAAPPPVFQLEKSPPDPVASKSDANASGTDGGASTSQMESFDSKVLRDLPAYLRIRSAGFGGWEETGMYVGAQPGRFPQLYQVAHPGGARKRLTGFTHRMAGFYPNPVPARRNFLYTQDVGGDEQFRMGLYDLRTGRTISMGAPPGRVDGLIWNDSGTAFAYSHTPAGTDRWDVRLGRTDGHDTLLMSLPGTWIAMDLRPDGKGLLLMKYLSASQSELHILDLESGRLTRLLPGDKNAYADHAQWMRSPRPPPSHPAPLERADLDKAWDILFTSDRDGEFHRLYRMAADSSARPVALSRAAGWDVEWACPAPDRRSLVYSLNEEGLSRLYYLDGKAWAALDSAGRGGADPARRLESLPEGVINEVVFRPGKDEFGFTLNGSAGPGDAYSYALKRGETTRWTHSGTGGLPEAGFRAPKLVRYPAFDSLPAAGGGSPRRRAIPAWLYLPDAKAFPGPRPALIQIHGGPEQQARPGFDPFVQFLVGKLGLAVVQPNVRGSSGYGRSYLTADDGYLRMGSVRDIGSLLDWIRTRPELDPARVAVSGRSYGGFMSLSALVEYGPRLRAGISAVGISHFPTFLKKTSGYRRDLRRAEYGDERDPRMAAFLDSISPLTRVDRIATPLLLCHGRNDPRVPFEESQRIFDGLKARKVPVWFLTFSEEGHAVKDQESQLVQWRTTAEFLVRELGPP